jgi:arsenite-transporting ATPase
VSKRIRGLWVVVGKGGVGKTAVAAAFGRALAGFGLHPLVIEVDPRESLDACFGVAPSAGEIVEAGRAHRGVRFLNLKPRAAFDAFAREKLRPHLCARPWTDKALQSPAYERFVEAAPGLAEMAILGQTRKILQGGVEGAEDVDVVVLDAPASGHAWALLEAPALVASTIDRGPLGRMGAELAAWVSDADAVRVVAVTTPEELPVDETLESIARLREKFGRPPALVVANAVFASGGRAGGWGKGTSEIRSAWELEVQHQSVQLERLTAHWSGPRVDLPFVLAEKGPALLDGLEPALAACLTALRPPEKRK